MRCTPFTPSSRATEAAGYTLIELLVGLLLSALVLSLLVRDLGFTVHTRDQMDQLLETQQGVRAALATVTQELRQAGACLPSQGDFVALGGTDDGVRDTFKLRIGRVNPDTVVCVRTVTTANAAQGTNTLTVQDGSGFGAGDWIYVTRNTGSGNWFTVSAVSANILSVAPALDSSYASGSGVYGVEERVYAVDASGAYPLLTVAIDGGAPQPLVDGVEEFDVQYRLTPCPPCDPIDEPADETEWHQVREVSIRVVVRARHAQADGDYVRLVGTTNVRPRNLL